MSVLHFVLKRTSTYSLPIPSKVYIHLVTANSELVFLPIPFFLPSFHSLSLSPSPPPPPLSKDPLMFHCGVRRFSAAPIFSQHTPGNKHKVCMTGRVLVLLILSTHTWQQTQGSYDWAGTTTVDSLSSLPVSMRGSFAVMSCVWLPCMLQSATHPSRYSCSNRSKVY